MMLAVITMLHSRFNLALHVAGNNGIAPSIAPRDKSSYRKKKRRYHFRQQDYIGIVGDEWK